MANRGGPNQIEATSTFSQTRKTLTAELEPTRGSLVVKEREGTDRISYHRFEVPTCLDGHAVAPGQVLRESDLTGSWKMHFNTHDYQVRLQPDAQLMLLGFYLEEWHLLEEGEWHIAGTRVTMRTKSARRESTENEDRTRFIVAIGKDCFSWQDDDGCQFTLERVGESELTARPTGVSPSTPSSLPPTRALSPAP